MKILKGILITGSIAFLIGCDPVEYSFTPEELKVVDSLYQNAKDSAEVEMKIVCDSLFEARFDLMVDSLSKVREQEILDIISK